MSLADEKEELANLFFECASYVRPSTEWIAALDLFTTRVIKREREACARICYPGLLGKYLPGSGKEDPCDLVRVEMAAAIRKRNNNADN